MFRRPKPVETKVVPPKPVELPVSRDPYQGPYFQLTCSKPGCGKPATHDLARVLGNAGTCHWFYCEQHWAARQAKKAGG